MTVVGPFGLSVRDQALEADVQAGLTAVEEGLLEVTKSEVPSSQRPRSTCCAPAGSGSVRCS